MLSNGNGIELIITNNTGLVFSKQETLRKKSPNMEFFLASTFPYSVLMWKNTDQKKLRIGAFLTQWNLSDF